MSLASAAGWSLLRSLVIALLSALLCRHLLALLGGCGTVLQRDYRVGSRHAVARTLPFAEPQAKVGFWALLLVPFLTPELVVGYAWGNFGLPLVHYPVWNELLYDLLVFMKVVPVGVVVLYFSPPPPVSAEALHCRRLLFGGPQKPGFLEKPGFYVDWAGYLIRGPLLRFLPAAGLVFLLAFQEFEVASLMGITAGRTGSPVSWTRTLFDNQQGVYQRWLPLRWALWPLTCQLAVLLPLLVFTWKSRRLFSAEHQALRRQPAVLRAVLWLYLVSAVVLVAVLPFLFLMRESVDGLPALLRLREQWLGLGEELLAGCAVSAGGAVAALLVAGFETGGLRRRWLAKRRAGRGAGWLIGRLALMPAALLLVFGLSGSLIVGLAVLYVFQTPALRSVYDTPLPLLVGLAIFLAPRALILELLLRAARPAEPVHAARLLKDSPSHQNRQTAGRLLWHLRWRGRFWGATLLAWWAFWELTLMSLLAPVSVVPVTVRLYNLMHYGHNAILSAMTLLAVAGPAVLAVLAALATRTLLSRLAR